MPYLFSPKVRMSTRITTDNEWVDSTAYLHYLPSDSGWDYWVRITELQIMNELIVKDPLGLLTRWWFHCCHLLVLLDAIIYEQGTKQNTVRDKKIITYCLQFMSKSLSRMLLEIRKS